MSGSLLDFEHTGLKRAMELNSQATATINKTQPNIKAPKKSIAGGGMSMLGGAGAGASIGGLLARGAVDSMAPGVGTAIGALLGGAQYFGA